MEGTVFNR